MDCSMFTIEPPLIRHESESMSEIKLDVIATASYGRYDDNLSFLDVNELVIEQALMRIALAMLANLALELFRASYCDVWILCSK